MLYVDLGVPPSFRTAAIKVLLQNRANKTRSNKEQEHIFLRGKPKRGKTTERTAAYHYNWRSITLHERTDPLRAINMEKLSLTSIL
jgi:hypothetical protein